MNTYDIKNIAVQVGFVIVEPESTQAEVSGIIQPNKGEETPQWGKVIALGDVKANSEGEPAEPTLDLKVGQTVIYKQWGGNKVEVGGKKYYFLKYEEIIGAVNES